MGLFTQQKPTENDVDFSTIYHDFAVEQGKGIVWYGAPDKADEACIGAYTRSGNANQAGCYQDSFIHLGTQAVSPFGIIHSGMYQMPIVGMMAAIVFLGVIKWLKLKTKVTV